VSNEPMPNTPPQMRQKIAKPLGRFYTVNLED
jgi:hypothetical protein